MKFAPEVIIEFGKSIKRASYYVFIFFLHSIIVKNNLFQFLKKIMFILIVIWGPIAQISLILHYKNFQVNSLISLL